MKVDISCAFFFYYMERRITRTELFCSDRALIERLNRGGCRQAQQGN